MTIALITLPAVKAQLNIPASNVASDTELQTYLEAASEIVINECGDVGGITSYTEVLPPREPDEYGRQRFVVGHAPVTAVASITPLFRGLAPLDLTALELDAAAGIIYVANTLAVDTCTIVYSAGSLAAVPSSLRLATAMIAGNLWKTKRAPGQSAIDQDGTGETELPGTGVAVPTPAAQLMSMTGHHAQAGFA